MARGLMKVIQVALTELRKIAEREGPEGALIMESADFTADFNDGRSIIVLKLQFRRDIIWTGKIKMSEMDLYTASDESFNEKVVAALRDTLTLAGQAVFVKLSELFPSALRKVDAIYIPEKGMKRYRVFFMNGHEAEGDEDEIYGDEFRARCTMIYDLPPI